MIDRPAPVLVEVWRGEVLETVHRGTVVVARADGSIESALGDPELVVLPRSSVKLIQALPLVESGAADAAHLSSEELALACASHQGAPMHTDRVARWLAGIGLRESDLLCGVQIPDDPATRFALRRDGQPPSQLHNACSGKHTGFLTLARHLNADPAYLDVGHEVQRRVREAMEELAGETSAAVAVDGCSAPNFALTLKGLATAMARLADSDATVPERRREAAARLRSAMRAHPLLVAGERRLNSALLGSARGGAVTKSGAAGVYVALLPQAKLGLALKMEDSGKLGAQAAIVGLLVHLGALSPDDPLVHAHPEAPLVNLRGTVCGRTCLASGLANC